MADVFTTSGENPENVSVPTPQLQGMFVPSIDNAMAVDGLGIVTPWGGGGTARRYGDYGLSAEVSRQSTQLNDLATGFIPGGGATYNLEGLVGPQGPRGPAGPPGVMGLTSLPSGYVLPINANFLAALPHNIDEINDLGTASDKLVYTETFTVVETLSGEDLCVGTTDGDTVGEYRLHPYWDTTWTEREITLTPSIEITEGEQYAIIVRAPDSTEWVYVFGPQPGTYSPGVTYNSDDEGVTWVKHTSGSPATEADIRFETSADVGSHTPTPSSTNQFDGLQGVHSDSRWKAQTFVATATETLTSVTLYFCRTEYSTPGDITVSIRNATVLYTEAEWAEADFTSAGRDLLDDTTAAAQATTLGLGTGDAVTHDTLTLSSIAHETTDVDKFLVDSTGVVKYRTGAEVLSDTGGQTQGDVLDDLNTLGVVASDGQFIVGTGAGAFAYESGDTARISLGVGTTDSPVFTGATIGSVAIPGVFTAITEPTGFVDRVATLSFDDGTHTFTITGNHDIYINGVKTTKTTASVAVVETVTGLYWIYYNATGTLTASTVHPGFHLPFVATVYWNTVTNKGMLGEERHSVLMDAAVHELLHYTVGSRFESGMSGTFDNTTLTITTGKWHDEDIEHAPAQQTTCNVLYKNGTVNFQWDAGVSVYYKLNGSNLRYNNGNALADCAANRHMAMWIFATNDITTPIVALMGQREDVTIAASRANNKYESLTLGTLPFEEMKLLYRVILKNTGSPPTYVETQDLRSISNIPAGTYVATEHGVLTGLTDDDHTQYALLSGRSGGQTLIGSTITAEDLTLKDNSVDNNTITVTQAKTAYTHSQVAGGNSVHVSTAENTAWDSAYTHSALTSGNPHSVTPTELSLLIGTDVQAYHANLAAIVAGTWVGANSITTLGTIATGIWEATDVGIAHGGTGQSTAQLAINALSAVGAATNEHVLTKDTGTGNAIWKVAAGGGTDVKVGVDVGATADYIGAANSDGVLRTGSSLSYTDGGNFVTINAIQDIQTTANPQFAGLGVGVAATAGTLVVRSLGADGEDIFVIERSTSDLLVVDYVSDSGTDSCALTLKRGGSTNIGLYSAGSGSIVLADGGTIGQAAGPLLTFNDTSNYLVLTGGNLGIHATVADRGITIEGANANDSSIKLLNTQASSSIAGSGIICYNGDSAAMGSGHRFGYMLFGGSRDASNNLVNACGVMAFASQNWVDGSAYGSEFRFETINNGATARTVKMTIANDGGIFMYNLKAGANQAAAGAAVDELYHDTDDNTIKIGV